MISWVSVADLHLREHDKWGAINPETGLNFRLEDRLNNLRKAVDFAIENKVDYFNILGDTFHTIDPGENLRALFYHTILPLFDCGMKVVILIGNHDTNGKVYNFLSEAVKGSLDVCDIVSEEVVEDGGFVFVPCGHESEIVGVKDKGSKILFSHFVLNNAEVGTVNYRLQSSYSIGMLDGFIWFELGDVHKAQEFGNGCYVGSIAKNDFGERNERKGFRYGVFKDGKVETEFISVDDREFIQIDIDEGMSCDAVSIVKKGILFGSNGDGLGDGVVCKVVVTGNREWIKSVDWNACRDLLKPKCSMVRFEYNRIDGKEVSSEMSFMKDRLSVEDFVKKYAEEQKFSKEDIEFGLGLLG